MSGIVHFSPSGKHTESWVEWSSTEAQRLIGFITSDLILAVKTGGLTNLVEEDQQRVLQELGRRGQGASPKSSLSPDPIRMPLMITGRGLPCGPSRRGINNQRAIVLSGLGIFIVLTWTIILYIGYNSIYSNMSVRP